MPSGSAPVMVIGIDSELWNSQVKLIFSSVCQP
jgi:hypothetical protein